MGDFHGKYKNRSYFEGWYFKHQNEGRTIALIPGISCGEDGEKSAFVQVITDDASYNTKIPYSSFHVFPHGILRAGNQLFSRMGVKIDLNTPELRCTGTVRYGQMSPPKSDVMGPFRFVPFLECRHGVISMKHNLQGALEINGKKLNFNGGTGYIEKDWGTSFPNSYLWVQCNRFSLPSCSIMISVADIPMGPTSFWGCIGVIHFHGQEYRLATYHGVQILRCDKTGVVLRQKEYLLRAEFSGQTAQNLLAPRSGAMARRIRESVACHARFQFFQNDKLLFDVQSDEAGLEYVQDSR